MNNILIHHMYFGSIAQFVAISNADTVVFETCDNYQKQTYRNRTYIYGANGKLMLSVPIKHAGGDGRQYYRDVRIENDFEWQKQHWRSLQTAYRTSPFFEYYEADLVPLFDNPFRFLLDFNHKCFSAVTECLQMDVTVTETDTYQLQPSKKNDLRHLVNSKKEPQWSLETYTQVFNDKYGFLSNLSVLDLLFNEGTNALNYLENQQDTLTQIENVAFS